VTNAPHTARATDAVHGGRVEERLAILEGAESALILGTGMAAIACTMLSLLRSGDHLVASEWLSGDARRFFESELPNLGIAINFVDPTETRGWRKHIRTNTRVLFVGTPTDPTTRVADLNPARLLAQELGIALVVDSTHASPINFRPLEHGADVVIHAGEAYLHSERGFQAGVVCGPEAVIDEVREKMLRWGQSPDAKMVEQLDRGVTTLHVRVTRQNANAERVAEWAAVQESIHHVLYPGLASHPDHEVAAATLDGFGSTIVLDFGDDAAKARRVVSRLSLFRSSTPIGGSASVVRALGAAPGVALADAPVLLPQQPIAVSPGAVRLGIGIEDPSDLIADLAQALE